MKRILKKRKKEAILLAVALLAGATALIGNPFTAYAQETDVIDTLQNQDIVVFLGDIVPLKVYALTRVAVTTPGIVDISKAEADEILIIGSSAGETTMFIWDEYGKRTLYIRVVGTDLEKIVDRLQKLLEVAGIKGIDFTISPKEGKIIATGEYKKDKKDEIEKILAPFEQYLMDLTKEAGKLIQIDVQVTELTETLTKSLGFDWNTGAQGFVFGYQETLPTTDGSIADLFKIGDFNRTTQILATVNALIQEGKGRVLSKPTVVVTDGEATTFLVGGEIPITTTTSTSGGAVQENVSFKPYGVNLTVTPTINGQKIDIDMNVSIRDIDSANAVGGNVAFTTTTASTKLTLEENQTIVLAGLIKHNESESLKRVPWLSKIPIVGILFRNKSTPIADKEVVVSLTPRIVENEKKDLPRQSEEKKAEGKEAAEDVLASEEMPEETGLAEEDISDGPAEEPLLSEEDMMDEGQPEAFPDEIFAPEEILPGALHEEDEEPGQEMVEEEDLSLEESPVTSQEEKEKNVSAAIASYVQSIQRKISEAISFPYEAVEKGWNGTVKLSLLVLSDGSLSQADIKESSGYEIFDRDARNTAQIVAPFDPFPAEVDLEEIVVTIPIVYGQAQ